MSALIEDVFALCLTYKTLYSRLIDLCLDMARAQSMDFGVLKEAHYALWIEIQDMDKSRSQISQKISEEIKSRQAATYKSGWDHEADRCAKLMDMVYFSMQAIGSREMSLFQMAVKEHQEL
jgi:hypothetical protein